MYILKCKPSLLTITWFILTSKQILVDDFSKPSNNLDYRMLFICFAQKSPRGFGFQFKANL